MKVNSVSLALFSSIAIATTAMAQDGQVQFTGKIIEEGCQVNSTVASPLEVKLGEVAKSALAQAGYTAATTQFTLVLTGCPSELQGKPVSVKYDGTPDTINNDMLQLTNYGASGTAKGVAIELLNASGSSLPLGTESEETTVSATDDTHLNFFARYVATESSVSTGDANSVVNFTLTYN